MRRFFRVAATGFLLALGGSTGVAAGQTVGSIVAWGAGQAGQTGELHYGQCDVPAPNSGFVAVAAGWVHSLGLKADGSIVAWGHNGPGQCNVPTPNSGFVAIAGGGFHSLAIRNQQPPALSVRPEAPTSFGLVHVGQTAERSFIVRNTGSGTLTGSASVAAPFSIVSGGTYTLGPGQEQVVTVRFAPVSEGDFAGAVTFSGPGGTLTREVSGTALPAPPANSIVAWGWNNYGQCNVPAPNSGFVAIAAGYAHSLAIRGDGDGDGVPDSLDLCLNTVPGTPVDSDGCPPMIPFDFLRDGDVDARDLMVFDFCSTGPTILGPPAGCAQATFDMLDRDQDGDVDMDDFGVFQRCYSGEDQPPDPACAE